MTFDICVKQSVPEETIVCYSKLKKIRDLILYLVSLATCIILGLLPDEEISGIIYFGTYVLTITGGLGMIWLAYESIKQIYDTSAKIVLSAHGMETYTMHFLKWSEIYNEKVMRLVNGKNSAFF